MPTREEYLNKFTNKDENFELEMRVFYTLTENKPLQAHRVAKALSLLIKHLHDKKLLNDKEIDDLLLDAVL